MTLIGLDFSINKPAACVYIDKKYYFLMWPYNINLKDAKILNDVDVLIFQRNDNKEKGDTLTEKMQYEVDNAVYLAHCIKNSMLPFITNEVYIALEGLSYASSGDVALQLGGYKYMLMHELSKKIPLKNMFTYSPITVKSIAGCAKRGMGKSDMINQFIKDGPMCKLRISLFENRSNFMKKGEKNYITHLDDLIDSYWILKTMQIKENLS